jgi:DNA-nicking Smr family endonuclease
VTRKPRLTDEDRQQWALYAQHLAPLRGRVPAVPASMPDATPPAEAVPMPVKPKGRPATRAQAAALAVGDNPGGVDRATWQRLRTGKLAPARTLDLHGRTAERAFHALAGFLRAAQADGLRCLEVITGRGTGEAGGVIRREFPHWLNLPEIRPLILGAAHPHALNQGSVRLILRRIR